MNKLKTSGVYSIFPQILILLGLAAIFGFLYGWLGFNSVLLGGIAWLLPSFFFIKRLKRIMTVFNIKKILVKFLLNEMFKLLSSFGLMVLILLTIKVSTVAFLSGYIVMIIAALSFSWLREK